MCFFEYFVEMTKNQFYPILMQLLMVPLLWADQKLPKTIEIPHLKWILSEVQQFVYKKIKQMAVAHSIFTLDGVVQLFWAAFDMSVTVVPLKVALGLEKFDFWAFQKNNHEESLDGHLCDFF